MSADILFFRWAEPINKSSLLHTYGNVVQCSSVHLLFSILKHTGQYLCHCAWACKFQHFAHTVCTFVYLIWFSQEAATALPFLDGRMFRHPSSLSFLFCMEAWSWLPCVQALCTLDPILILKCVFNLSIYKPSFLYVEIKCQLDATEVFIADLIACSTCFGHQYAHHQELKSIIQWLLPVVFRAVVFQVAGLVWSWGLCVLFAGCW